MSCKISNDQFIYVHPPKCAGKTFEHSLFGFKPMAKSCHCRISDYSEEEVNKKFKMTFVRNPYDRFVSYAYDFCRRHGKNQYQTKNIKEHMQATFGLRNDYKPFRWANNYSWSNKKNQMTKTGPGAYWNCSDYVTFKGENVMDFIGRVETFEKSCLDLVLILKNKNLEAEAKKVKNILDNQVIINRSSERKSHYREYYTDQLVERCEIFFKPDLEMFSYEF